MNKFFLSGLGILLLCLVSVSAIPANTLTGVNSNNLRNNYQFEENTGTITVDRGSVPINLTWTNPAWSTVVKQGNFSANFSGGNALNDTNLFSYYDSKTTVSMGGWFNASTQSGIGRIGLFDNGCSATMFTIEFVNKTRVRSVVRTSGGEFYSNNVTVTGDMWHLIVMTYNGTHNALYVDGSLSNSTVVTGGGITSGCPSTDFTIAQLGSYRGFIDDLGLWNITLSAANILEWNTTVPPSVAFFNLTPASGSQLFFTHNYLELSTTINNIPSYGNTTIQVFNSTGSLVYQNVSSSNITNVNVTGLLLDNYFFNATVVNATNSVIAYTTTSTVLVYNLSSGSFINPSSGSSVGVSVPISWSSTSSVPSGVSINNYVLQLFNSSGQLNSTLNSTVLNSFLWFNLGSGLDVGNYSLLLMSNDSNGNEVNSSVSFILAYNAQLNISVFNGSSVVGNFSVNVSDLNTGLNQFFSTVSGLMYINVSLNHNFSIFVDAVGFAYNSSIVSSVAPLTNVSFGLVVSNSINITVFSQDSGLQITSPSSAISFLGSLYSYNFTASNGSLFVSGLSPDVYSVSVSVSGFNTRSYIVTLSNRSTQVLNVYLPSVGNSSAIGMFLQDTANNPLTGSIVVQRLVGSSYVTIASVSTDVTGFAQVYLDDGEPVQLILSADGYSPRTSNFVPYSANSPYTFKLLLNGSSNFISPNSLISYAIFPVNVNLRRNVSLFSFQTVSMGGVIESFGQSCFNDGVNFVNSSNVSIGSPNGGTVAFVLDLSNFSGRFNCSYFYDLDGFSNVSFVEYYWVSNFTIPNNTLIVAAEQFRDDNDSVSWTAILGMFLTLVFAIIGAQWGQGNRLVPSVITIVCLVIFTAIGWFGVFIPVFVISIIALMLYIDRG